jgi:hypothetical protein
MNQGKEPTMEMQADFEIISNRTLLVLYFTCVRHPYLFPLLRQVCTTLHDDKELEIDFLKYSKIYNRSIDGLKYVLGRLEVHVDSLSTETLMDYIIQISGGYSRNYSDTEASEIKSRISEMLLMKMRGSEKHKHLFEGRVRCHYHSLEKCSKALMWASRKGVADIVPMLLADPRVDPSM